MRAAWRIVHDRHTGASTHVPDAGDGRPRQPRASIHGTAHRRRNRVQDAGGSQLTAYSDSD
eukprot:10173-Pleurochrysis_carterae.AAC.1